MEENGTCGTGGGFDDEQKVSRKKFLAGGAAAGVAVGLGGGALGLAKAGHAAGGKPTSDGDLALINGRIHTMDGSNRVVSEVLIQDGRFADVGRIRGDRGTKVVNLRGRTVVPGLLENHNHIVLMGLRPGHHTPLENAYSIADVQATYRARARDVPDGEWITTIGGFSTNQFTERRLPNRTELDAAAPQNPVFIQLSFTGPSTTNSAGKAFFESKGIVVGADGSMAASPFFGTGPTTQALLELRRMQTFEERKRGCEDAMAYAVTVGLTTQLDQGAFAATGTPADGAASENLFTMHLPWLELHAEGKLKIRLRINFLEGQTDPTLDVLRNRLKFSFPFFGDDFVRTGGIGEFTADGIFAGSALWLEGTKLVAQAGWRNENHSLTQTDFKQIIDGWQTVNQQFPITDLRWVVAHVPFFTAEYADKLKALGGGVSLTGWRYLEGTAANNGPPFRMILDNGIHAGMGGDGMQIAPMNPWLHMYYAVTGKNARGDVINAGQQISRQEAISLYTSRNKWFIHEDDLGSIEVGNHADLVVLNQDYFSLPSDEDMKKIRSVLTVVGGQVMYDAGVLK